MRQLPDICRHKGILTHYSDYPQGSIERAKSLGIELLSRSKSLEITLELWETELKILNREQPWKALGLKCAEDFVKAVIGKSTKDISKEIAKRTQIRNLRQQHPDWTQQQIADEVGVDQSYVSRVMTKMSESDNSVIPPDDMSSRTDRADFRKLPTDIQEAVCSGRMSLNQAAINAGIRKKLSQAEICVKAFRKAENRLEALRLITSELEPHEAAVLSEWLLERVEA